MRFVRTLPLLALPIFVAACDPSTDAAPRFEFNQGPLVSSGARPVPITGGTLLVTRDGLSAIASDPERDTISIVDLASKTVRATITLRNEDEPARIAEDFSGVAHIALRRGGAVVDVDIASGQLVGRHDVCAAPRGIAYDGYRDAIHVACAGGELVSLDRTSGAVVRQIEIAGGDLRDVIVPNRQALLRNGVPMGAADGDHLAAGLYVTRFRSAELLLVNEDGSSEPQSPPTDFCNSDEQSDVAWRTVELGETGQLAMLHQRARSSEAQPVETSPGGYGGGGSDPCGGGSGIVKPALSLFQFNFPIASNTISNGVLAVDVASSRDGSRVAVAMPGNVASPFPQIVVGSPGSRLDPASGMTSNNGGGDTFDRGFVGEPSISPPSDAPIGASPIATGASAGFVTEGQAIAVAFIDADHILVQTREPSALEVINLQNRSDVSAIVLANDSRADTGQYLFHAGAGQMIACASCHPEGGDDGHVWNFASLGERRTQSIAGGILGTEPFHWNGDQRDFGDLVTHVFTERMGAGEIGVDHKDALSHYVDRLDIVPPSLPSDMSQVERGQALFESERTQCTSCHSGPMLTNNATVDVGTGGSFQVPTLVGVSHRAPLIHNGCVASIRERFTNSCAGGDRHGHTSDLTSTEIDDLTAFLKTI